MGRLAILANFIKVICLCVIIFSPAKLLAADAGNSQGCEASIVGGINCARGNLSNTPIQNSIKNIINTTIVAAGVVAVIFIIVGGMKYVFSQGEEKNLLSAKNTILYAIIGLIICLLAFAIVNFVLTRI